MVRQLPRAFDPGKGGLTPERKLLMAILERAVSDALGAFPTGSWAEQSALRADAMQWLWEDEPYGFPWVCEHLGLDYERVRAGIMRLQAKYDTVSFTNTSRSRMNCIVEQEIHELRNS